MDPADDAEPPDAPEEPTRVWLVERTYAEDEQNMLILVYATPDGQFYHRKERALTSLSGEPATAVAITVEPHNLGRVQDDELAERYASEAERMAAVHDPDDAI